jgi:hypothetical protein
MLYERYDISLHIQDEGRSYLGQQNQVVRLEMVGVRSEIKPGSEVLACD